MRIKLIVFFLPALLMACEEEFRPQLDEYEKLLVVDGAITNQLGPYTVKLSLSTNVYIHDFEPLQNAEVSILDDAGISEQLSEVEPGIYQSSIEGIQGIIGRKYSIAIHTSNGKSYHSEFEELKEPTSIENVYAEIEYHQDKNYDYDLAGYQFYLDSGASPEDSTNFLWKIVQTYEYKTDFLAHLIWDGRLETFPKPDSIHTCWKTDYLDRIFTFNTQFLSEPVISRFPLHYVNTEARQLAIRYSLLVKQYRISDDAYTFWSSLEEQQFSQGALYSKQPFQIKGNVKNSNDSQETVLGYFMTAGLSEKRIFVDRPSIPFNYSFCTLGMAEFESFVRIAWSDPIIWPLYITQDNVTNQKAWTNQACVDCRKKGGTTTRPDFWID
ncbi:MAG: DUF4249 domain-containing protein [Bacteroidetes bacterium]|nr:DUF4249 domain-containing protein [Bacteroidota bacterium]